MRFHPDTRGIAIELPCHSRLEQNMKRTLMSLVAALMIGGPMLAGCDRTISEERSVEQKRDGTVVTEEKKVTESPDGTIKKTEEKEVSR